MVRTFGEIETEALRLSRQERALLAARLLSTPGPGEDVDAEESWLIEAETRYEAYRAGRISAKPGTLVFEDAKKRLR